MNPDSNGLEELDNAADCAKLVNVKLTIHQETYKCQHRINDALQTQKKKIDGGSRHDWAHTSRMGGLCRGLTSSDRSCEYTFMDTKRTAEELLRSKAEVEQRERAHFVKWQELESHFVGDVWNQFTAEYSSSILSQKVSATEAQVKQEELRQRFERAAGQRSRAAAVARVDVERRRDRALLVTFARGMSERTARVRAVEAAHARLVGLARERARERSRKRARSACAVGVKSLDIDWDRIEQRESSLPKVAKYRAPPPPRRENISLPYTNPNNFMEMEFTMSAVIHKPCGTKLKYGFWRKMPNENQPPGIEDACERGANDAAVHKRVMENIPVLTAPAPKNIGKDDVATKETPTHKEKVVDDIAMNAETDDVTMKVAPTHKMVMDDVAMKSGTAGKARVMDDVAMKMAPSRKIRVLEDVPVNAAAAKAIVQAAQLDKSKFVDVITTRPNMQQDYKEGSFASLLNSYPTSRASPAISNEGLLVPPSQFQDTQGGNESAVKKENKLSHFLEEGGVQVFDKTTSTAAEEAAAGNYRDLREKLTKLSCSPTFTYAKKNTEVTSKFFNTEANIAHSDTETVANAGCSQPPSAPAVPLPPPTAATAAPPPPLGDIPVQGKLLPPEKCYGAIESRPYDYGPALSLNLTDNSELDDTYDFTHMLGTPSLLLSPRADDPAPAAAEPPASMFGLRRPSFSTFGPAAGPGPSATAPPTGEPSTGASASEQGFNFNFQAKKKGGFFSLFN